MVVHMILNLGRNITAILPKSSVASDTRRINIVRIHNVHQTELP